MATNFSNIEFILNNYISEVKAKMKIDRVFLYGSYAKGVQNEQSDLDICFLSSNFDGLNSVDIIAELLSIARKYKEICIEPVAFSTSEIA